MSQSAPCLIVKGQAGSVYRYCRYAGAATIEDEAQSGKMDVLHITVHRDIALFILNHKRASLADIESRFALTIILHSDGSDCA